MSRVGRPVPLPNGHTLAVARLHEWFVGDASARHSDAPLCLFADVARRALLAGKVARLAWVGREACPSPRHLGAEACRASIVVDPPARDSAARLWAIDLLLRSGTPLIVFATAERLTLAHTRRLQLAASCGVGLCLLSRPARELQSLSAAATRWRVEPAPSPSERPRWTVTLLRDKDRPAFTDEREVGLVELDGAKGVVHLPAVGGDGQAAAARAAS